MGKITIRTVPDAEIEKLINDLDKLLKEHEDHPWHKIGRCVYCGPCGKRLGQFDIPTMHPIYNPKPITTEADKMRKRWGKE